MNAGTKVSSKQATSLGITNVRGVVLYAQAALNQPLTNATKTQYSNATDLLDAINNNKNLVY